MARMLRVNRILVLKKWAAFCVAVIGATSCCLLMTNSRYQLNIKCGVSEDQRIAARLADRRTRIYRACRKYGRIYRNLTLQRTEWDVVVDNVVWRPVLKAGSTFMSTIVLRKLRNDIHYQCSAASECYDQVAEYRRQRRAREGDLSVRVQKLMQKDLPPGQGGSVIILRDPMARLVSAYQDKMREAHFREELFTAVGMPHSKNAMPTFSDFVEAVIRMYVGFNRGELQYVDAHYMPVEESSWLCSSNFQYLLQLETIDEEIGYVARALGLGDYVTVPIGFRHQSAKVSQSHRDLFNQISDSQLRRLHDIFFLDIVLFHSGP